MSAILTIDIRIDFDALLERLGPPQRVWEEMGPYIREMVGPRVYRALEQARQARYLEALFASLEQCGAVAVTREDETYPQDLLTIADPRLRSMSAAAPRWTTRACSPLWARATAARTARA